MRLFVAAYPPPAAQEHLQAAVDRLHLGAATAAGQRVGLVPADRWHVTLAFLGDVSPEQAQPVAEALRDAVELWRSAPEAAAEPASAEPASGEREGLELWLADAGTFGRGRSTVLWVGLDGELARLRALASRVRRTLRCADLPVDDGKPFRAHLTIARPGGRVSDTDLAADLSALAEYRGPAWRLAEVRLMHSRPGPRPAYETVATVPVT